MANGLTVGRRILVPDGLGSNPSSPAMENIDGFSVERKGDDIIISFYDVFGQGESYVLTVKDARQIMTALEQTIGP